jgi:hypothetical protein
MKGRNNIVVFMLFALFVVCLIVGPVLSGEHPWDSDRDGGGTPGGNYYVLNDTTPAVSTVDEGSENSGSTTATWSALVGYMLTSIALAL